MPFSLGTRPTSKLNVLVVYFCNSAPLRSTLRDHLYSFRNYSGHNIIYLNLAVRGIPWYLKTVPIHLVIFHTLFLGRRGVEAGFGRLIKKAEFLKNSNSIKVVIPQDEFIHSEQLCQFINDFNVCHVFSSAPATEWPKIYSSIDRNRINITQVLTGYLDEKTVTRINQLEIGSSERDIDIGYRTQRLGPSTGRHGQIKNDLADVAAERSDRYGLISDISTRNKDILVQDDWFGFLLHCKYTIGVEGGTSILDPIGAIKEKVEEYLALHPSASFEQVEDACFPGIDGSLSLFAISPRHLEACATKTCQILVEGRYNGILSSGEHYIELKRDFSNVDEVFETVKRDDLRAGITERAYKHVVESGKFTYQNFVDIVVDGPLKTFEKLDVPRVVDPWIGFISLCARLADGASWIVVHVMSLPRNFLRKTLSEENFDRIAVWSRRIRRK